MNEFCIHWIIFCEVKAHLAFENPDGYCVDHERFPYGEDGSLFQPRATQGVLAHGVHKDICRSMNEYPQFVCLERVAGKPVTFHSLLELPYEQLVLATPAVVLLVEVMFHHALNVGHYEPDVEHTLLGVFRLDHHTLREHPCASLIVELPVCSYRMLKQFIIMADPFYRILCDRMIHQYVIFRQTCDKEYLAVIEASPVHQLMGTEMAISTHRDYSIWPHLSQAGDEPHDGVLETCGLVLAPWLEERQNHLSRITLEDHQWHIAVAVIVSIEKALLLTPVGIHVGVVTVKYDMVGNSSAVGQYEHSHEHLLYAEQVIVRDHVLESAHGGGRTQIPVLSAGVDGQLHHWFVSHTVAVIDILVAEANLKNARHDDFHEAMTNQIGGTAVVYAVCQLRRNRQAGFFLTQQPKTSIGGKGHCIGIGLNFEVIFSREVKFL